MRIVTLVEDTAGRDGLGCEHGLSLYMETGEHRILFDMGQTELFAENAEKLGIDLEAVDFAVVSHGHYDHGGGLEHFLRINATAPVYVARSAFGSRRNGAGKEIGLKLPTAETHRLHFVDDFCQISPGIALVTCEEQPLRVNVEAYGLTAEDGGRQVPDDFRHEQYLLVEEAGKRICISGCSHKGIRNIIHWLSPDILIGGFHLVKETDREILEQTARDLLACSADFYTGHCTGTQQYAVLKSVMGSRLHNFCAGSEWHL